MDMELIVKTRPKSKGPVTTLTLLGWDLYEMGLFLEEVLDTCEKRRGISTFQNLRSYLAARPDLFATSPEFDRGTGQQGGADPGGEGEGDADATVAEEAGG